jgi:hypothetical protein
METGIRTEIGEGEEGGEWFGNRKRKVSLDREACQAIGRGFQGRYKIPPISNARSSVTTVRATTANSFFFPAVLL